MAEQGKVLRQGDLVLVNRSKHQRRVFLFEHSIVFTKKKLDKHKAAVAASEIFEYKSMSKVRHWLQAIESYAALQFDVFISLKACHGVYKYQMLPY